VAVFHDDRKQQLQFSRFSPFVEKARLGNLNLLFLPDLHSLNLLKGQLVPRSIINPGGRRTRMSGDPLPHEVPVHSKAKEAVDLWLERSYLASNPSAPFFPSFGKNRETLNWRRLDRRSVLKLVEKRAKTSGILKRVCCHSFRATGVTEYMNSGGAIEIASFPRFSWNRNQRAPPRS
jgi:integrase